MQPHLKKCFEGIAKLVFTENQEVKGMISSEKESVPFSKTIVPADAKVRLLYTSCCVSAFDRLSSVNFYYVHVYRHTYFAQYIFLWLLMHCTVMYK